MIGFFFMIQFIFIIVMLNAGIDFTTNEKIKIWSSATLLEILLFIIAYCLEKGI